jgi:hAT family C-terminal dimerisation region
MSDVLNDFGNVSLSKNTLSQGELEEYLSLPVEYVRDPMQWWFDNRIAYPNLSKMAFDYLSIPGKNSHIL